MHCWARSLFIIVVVALGILSMLGACGQKGPLYLPEKPTPKTTVPSTSVPVGSPATATTRPNLH